MAENRWKRAAPDESVQEGKPSIVTIDGRDVLMTRYKGKVCAYGNECTHAGGPLNQGIIDGEHVICPWHNARFDLRDGSMVSPPALDDLPVYSTKVEAGEVMIGDHTLRVMRPVASSDSRVFAILGAGAAGAVAAETMRRIGFGGEILLFSAETELPYDRTMLSKSIISGDADAESLPLRDASFYERLNIRFKGGYRANRIDPRRKIIYFENGKQQAADKILLATGSRPRALRVRGAEKRNHFLLRSAAQAGALIDHLRSAQSVVLVGASFIALEVGSGLARRKIETHIVAPESEPLELAFGPEIGRWIRSLHEGNGVRFHLGRTVKEIRGNESVENVVLDDESGIRADTVITGVGVEPVVDYLKETGIVENGVVPVNGLLETSAVGIYAAGDIALVPYPMLDEKVRVEHWVAAQCQGQHAARTMTGATSPFRQVPFFWTRQYDVSIKYVGYPARHDRVVFRGMPGQGSFVAGFYRDGGLRGAAAVGMGEALHRIEKHLAEGRDLPKKNLADPSAALD